MKKNSTSAVRYRKIIQALYGFGAVLAVFYTVMVMTSYDKNMHYFAYGDIKPTIYVILSIVLCCAALLSAFLLPKDSVMRRERVRVHKTPASFVCSALCLFAMLAMAASRIFAEQGPEIINPVVEVANRIRILNILLILFSVLSAIFFLLDILRANAVLRSVFGFAIVGFFIVYLLCIYYDTEIPINSPMRILDQVSVIATLMWFLLEERNLLRQAKPYLYVALGVISFTFSLSLSVSTLLAAGLDKMNAGTNAIIGSVMLFAFALWSATRVHSLVKNYCTEK